MSLTYDEVYEGLDGALDLITNLKNNEAANLRIKTFIEHTVRSHLKHGVPLPKTKPDDTDLEYVYYTLCEMLSNT